ncbi:MAG: class I adenylate-forming enzyme family protein [Lautropia sp.]
MQMLDASFAVAGDRTAVVDGALRLSYRELDAVAEALSSGLAARGVGKGDRVAVMATNRYEAVVAVVALARMGAIIVPIGARLKRPEIGYIFEDALPTVVLHDPDFGAELPEHGPAPGMRFAFGSPAWAALLAARAADAPRLAAISEEDAFGILYTSGTTGKPKGAVLSQLNVVHSCLHWQDAHAMGKNERTILAIPWSHVAGLCGVMLPFLSLGGTLCLLTEFKRRDFLEMAQRERITHALMAPAMYGLCLLESDLAQFDLSSWRLGVYGSAPMPEPTIRRFAQAFPNLQMCNAYGATETTSPATIMPPGDGVSHSDSVGKVVGCGDVRVMDEQGRELPPGEEGELWIAGPMVVGSYWNKPQATEASFVGGYWKSGDIGAVDARGYVRIADRKKDMIIRGGFKVYPAEVESVLTAIDGVTEAAVVGLPDSILGETVVAFLNCDARLQEGKVRAFCAEHMADYKVPDHVVIGAQPLPRNANGKIQKAELRAMASALAPPLVAAPARPV